MWRGIRCGLIANCIVYYVSEYITDTGVWFDHGLNMLKIIMFLIPVTIQQGYYCLGLKDECIVLTVMSPVSTRI